MFWHVCQLYNTEGKKLKKALFSTFDKQYLSRVFIPRSSPIFNQKVKNVKIKESAE